VTYSSSNLTSVQIRALAFGGDGVGEVYQVEDKSNEHLLGITTFVPYTIPGERVLCRIIEEKKHFLRGEVVSILESSPFRVSPPCSVFEQCGGCELQHLRDDEERNQKEALIKNQMLAARIPQSVIDKIQPIVFDEPYSYRRRVTLHIDERGAVGFFRAKTRSIIPIKQCHITNEKIQEYLVKLYEKGTSLAPDISTVQFESDPKGVI